jgi:excinuclease UvrABC nuclease subunit
MDFYEKIRTLPTQPGVYLYKNAEGQVIYVGKAKNLRARVRSYLLEASQANAKTGSLMREAVDLEYILVANEHEALALENNLIKQRKPRFNILLRDDKTYPYVKLTLGDRFPKVFVTRRLRKDGAAYYGPYFPGNLAYRIVELIHRSFLIPSCKVDLSRYHPRACLQYYIHRCLGPCVEGLTTPTAYAEAVRDAQLFLEGRHAELERTLTTRMMAAAEAEQYEAAARLRDQLSTVHQLQEKQRIATAEQGDDADVFGYHFEGGSLAVNLFHVRAGKIVDRREFFWEELPELLEAAIPEPAEAAYAAYVLTDAGRSLLLEKFPPKFPDTIAHHVTFEFGVPEGAEAPHEAKVTVVGYAADESLEAVVVSVGGESIRSDGGTYHVTLSLDRSKGRRPSDSNQVIEAKGWTKIDPPFEIRVTPGILGIPGLNSEAWEATAVGSSLARSQPEQPFQPGPFFSALLKQLYIDQQYVPRTILVPAEFDDREALAALLTERTGHRIEIAVPQRGEKRSLVDLAGQNAKQSYMQRFRVLEPSRKAIQEALADALMLPELPRRIECFDISHIQGAETVASLVVWEDGKMNKALYRKFQIKTVEGVDDFASMREVITRRYKRLLDEEQPMPSLILVDGGLGQLHAAAEALESLGLTAQPLASIAKKEEIIYLYGNEDEPVVLDRRSPVLHLVQLIRDESHRFAIGYHRQRRAMRDRDSELLNIPGVGAQTRQRLLTHFGSLREVQQATAESLAAVVPRKTAETIWRHFHEAQPAG